MKTLAMCIKTSPALRDAVKWIWQIYMISLIGILLSCGCSSIEDENHEENVEQPDLTDMALIPAGEFLMGSPEGEGAFDEHPQHAVYLDDYYIDKYEVTNAQFKEFVEATGYVTDVERIGRARVWNPKETYANIYVLSTSREYQTPNYKGPMSITKHAKESQPK